MNNNHASTAVQAHLDRFFSQLAECPELEGQLSPEDLPQLLQAGLSHVLNSALKKERQFHLEDHPRTCHGYAPKRTLKVGTTVLSWSGRAHARLLSCGLAQAPAPSARAYQQLLRNILFGGQKL